MPSLNKKIDEITLENIKTPDGRCSFIETGICNQKEHTKLLTDIKDISRRFDEVEDLQTGIKKLIITVCNCGKLNTIENTFHDIDLIITKHPSSSDFGLGVLTRNTNPTTITEEELNLLKESINAEEES